ncbi:MAG: FAD-binding oxidoreductase [Candidatus Thorarchaeota archaeon]
MTNKIFEEEGLKITFTSFYSEHPDQESKKAELAKELMSIVGEKDFTNKEAELISYKATYVAKSIPMRKSHIAKGEHTVILPSFAVYPKNTEEVQGILKVANKYKVPVTPIAGASGLGVSAPKGGIILDLKKLDKIIEIDEISHTVTVQPGMYVYDLENELNKKGYELVHYPASYFCSTIGGFIGDRSAGRLSTKYGKIEKMVIGQEIVTPTGEVFRTPKVPAHAVGPDLDQLFIGMGGTIGVTTEVTLKIYEIPEARLFRSFLVPTLDDGFEVMRKIMQKDLNPNMARLYDPIETDSELFKHLTTDKGKAMINANKGHCYLILGFDGDKDIVDLIWKKAEKICFDHNSLDMGYEEGQFWWDHALDDYYKGLGRATRSSQFFGPDVPSVGGVYDFIVPMKYIGKIWKEIEEQVAKEFDHAIIYGHFSHWYKTATMMYPMWYVWNLEDTPEAVSKAWYKMQNIVLKASLKYEGAFQHHHGVGTSYGTWMEEQWGKAGWKLIKDVKNALDPNGIMNPGNMGFD